MHVVNGAMRNFFPMLIHGAAILDCEPGVVEVPLTF